MDANDDPFDSIAKLCIISDSQAETLARCSFAGVPRCPDAYAPSPSQVFYFAATGFCRGLPERLEGREQLTPRNDSSPQFAAAVSGGYEAAVEGGHATRVDLGKNPDLGFQNDEIQIIGVRRRQSSESEAGRGGESSSKRFKSSKEALGSASSVPIALEKVIVDLDSPEFSGESRLVDHNDEMAEEVESLAEGSHKIDGGKVSNGDSGEETHRNDEEKSAEKEVSEKRVENSQPHQPSMLKETTNPDQSQSILPSSINIAKEADATASGTSENHASIVSELMKILGSEEDKELANMSILEVVSRRGMTFPRPCWWPEDWDFSFK